MIEKCFDSPSFNEELKFIHFNLFNLILKQFDSQDLTFHTKTAINNLVGSSLLKKLENVYPEILLKCKFIDTVFPKIVLPGVLFFNPPPKGSTI